MLDRIDVFSRWIGFAHPPSQADKLTVRRVDSRFVREWPACGAPDHVPAQVVEELRTAVSRPPIAALDPTLFDLPLRVVQTHYESMWTDDHPEMLVRLTFAGGGVLEVRTDAQQAFMLPFQLSGSESDGQTVTFDPRLSRAIAAVLPDDFLNKERLLGRSWLLDDPAAGGSSEDAGGLDDLGQESAGEEAEVEREGPGHTKPLLKRSSSVDELRTLLQEGANPNVADDVDQTLLMHAAFPPFDLVRFRLLTEAGADLEARRKDGLTGLHLACAGGEVESAAEWVRAGANVHARTPEGATPLMLAASWPRIVALLLDAGADVNATDQEGDAALTYAVAQPSWQKERQLDAIRLLISAGADVGRRNKRGETPLTQARRQLAQAQVEGEVAKELAAQSQPREQVHFETQPAEAVLRVIESALGWMNQGGEG